MHRAVDALVSGLLFLTVMYFVMQEFIVVEVNTARVVKDSSLTDVAETAADYIVLRLGDSYDNWVSVDEIKNALSSFIDAYDLYGSGIDLLVKVSYYRLRNEFAGRTILVVDDTGTIYSDNIDAALGLPHSTASRSIVANNEDGRSMLVYIVVVAYRSG